ncbi:hypothetical protein DMH26_17645 [Streptomyces sp. WAC 05379]|uniref:hypothetical protein n=1 Tax=Streptomyces sp. WAC 05379 TaxID=2203207 RepID=UPI000F7412C3|nr:hypothetical protein [Streptomyces sp. WAC 05379]RSN99947.1 hypothetical protein DMH26_17645 [Streptomyces sp. WAC 05379]
MSASLTPLTVQRLAYVRYLYQEGIEQSRQPSPLRARSITSFHDAVENFIGLTAEHLRVELKPRMEFLQYWEVLKPSIEMPGKTEMKRLNDARIALKHHGTFPSAHQIEQARDALVAFFSTVTPKVFGVDFDSVDMIDLVTQAEVAQYLRDAQTHADIGDYSMACAGLTLAFRALLEHCVGDTHRGHGPLAFGPNLYWFDRPKIGHGEEPQGGRLDKLSSIAAATQEALRAASLGIDYQSLARFQATVPRVDGYYDGTRRYIETESVRRLTADDYDWARHFVIESALRASRADDIANLRRTRTELNEHPQQPAEERSWAGPADPSDV